jgi:hypothetical protein
MPEIKGLHDSENNGPVLITKDLLPDNDGYRISFVGVNGGLLRRNPYGSIGQKYIPAPDAFENGRTNSAFYEETLAENPMFSEEDRKKMREIDQLTGKERFYDTVDFIYTSPKGYEMYQQLGWKWFQTEVFEPEKWHGQKIGEGSEAVVYRAMITGKDCVVKLINYNGIDRFNKVGKIFGLYIGLPDFQKKFGANKSIYKVLKTIVSYKPLETMEFTEPPEEYVMGRDFLIEKFKAGTSLKKSLEENMNLKPEIVKGIQKELDYLDDLFFYIGFRTTLVFEETDFSLENIMVEGMTNEGKLKVFVIDQKPGDISSNRNDAYDEKGVRYKKLSRTIGKDPLVKKLKSIFN